MKTLKIKFKLNDLAYTLLKRNEIVALYGIGGEYTDEILHYSRYNIHPEGQIWYQGTYS